MTRRVPGLSDDWAQEQLDLLELAEAAAEAAERERPALELPGMWEPADYLGGAPDQDRVAGSSSGNETVTEDQA